LPRLEGKKEVAFNRQKSWILGVEAVHDYLSDDTVIQGKW